MTTNKPEVVAWYTPTTRDTLPVVALNDRSQRGEPLIRLSDYEALQAELADMERDYLVIIEAQDAEHRKQLARLQAECEQLRKDAGRYRYLADECCAEWRGEKGPVLVHATPWTCNWRVELDAAIDAAMAKEEQS